MGSARACPGDVGGTWPREAVTKIDAGVPVFRVSPGCAACACISVLVLLTLRHFGRTAV